MPTDRTAPETGSILDTIGHELIGVMAPVSICMLVVVLLVTAVSSPPSSPLPPTPVTAANLVYQESPFDSPFQKLGGALLNAAVFVFVVAAATFLLVLLYYYNFTSCLRNYMRFSAFFVLASMGGSILVSLLRRLSLPLDAPSALLLLFNASALGVLSVFSPAVPILLRQSYTVALGVIAAAWFTRLPEWTTWTLLLALALYDLIAVLSPRGPLRLLLDLASSRDDELPALVYEARPTVPPSPSAIPLPVAAFAAPTSLELQPLQHHYPPDSPRHSVIEIEHLEETSLLVPNNPVRLPQPDSATSTNSSEMEMFNSTRGIRLGLGDFVFYSVLVGRAAMYDLMTVYACYLAIISGLGCTLILLSVHRHGLPALPISIVLGMVFYFLTRLLMEPFVVGASTNLFGQQDDTDLLLLLGWMSTLAMVHTLPNHSRVHVPFERNTGDKL